MRRVKEIPPIVKCTECGSKSVAALGIADEDMKKVILKNGARLSEREKDLVSKAEDTAKLVDQYGRLAVYALAGRRVQPEAAGDILRRHRKHTNDFFEIGRASCREGLKERFW